MTKAELAMYAANAAVRGYTGPVKLPDGNPRPLWKHLLDSAASARITKTAEGRYRLSSKS